VSIQRKPAPVHASANCSASGIEKSKLNQALARKMMRLRGVNLRCIDAFEIGVIRVTIQPTEPETIDASATAQALVISVGDLIGRAKNALERALPLQWVAGEISGFKRAASGHCYFDLKDDQSQIACVLYRNRAALVGFELRDGVQVELRVRPSIYEPRGSLQFAVEQARLAGVGRLYEAFLQLKAKLTAEGLFDESTQRPLPSLPETIGLITSPQAAALADMLRVLRDRWPRAKVILYPSSVQGVNAPRELLRALNAANDRSECNVLIIGRGGGSMEDLWAFNDEALVRAVASSAIPIVSAVGHETDFTLCDFAADARAPTPTAAAAMVVPERDAAIASLRDARVRISEALGRRVERAGERIDRASQRMLGSRNLLAPWRERLLRLQSRIDRATRALIPIRRERLLRANQRFATSVKRRSETATRVTQLGQRLNASIDTHTDQQRQTLARFEQALALLNPANVLERGYAMVFDARGNVITDASSAKRGARITAQLRNGTISANVVDPEESSRGEQRSLL
jgi:exodeoxyribonuclease VII large subunit